MKRIESTLENIKTDIGNYYKSEEHHFIVMNAVELGGMIEVQWFFCDYKYPSETTTFFIQVQPDVEIPSITGIVASAWVAEAELVDLMNIKIENTTKGFVLEPDVESGPLRKKK